jgi:UDP-3-O-[3-hydroxymyristoyl] glucosamine N-acyltransferase
MEFTAAYIAEILNGEVLGNPNATVNTFAKIEEGREGALSFLANPKYIAHIYSCKSSIVLVSKTFVPEKEISCTLIKVDDPYASFAILMQAYEQQKSTKTGISSTLIQENNCAIGNPVYIDAFVKLGKNVKIGKNVLIHSFVNVGDNVEIGDNTTIYSNVNIYADSKIGNHCTIHAGVVIGSDGFGFAPQSGNYLKVPQIGNVIIEDYVEIGANSTIDRATMGSTIIRKGVKLDNQIQVAHNVEIGENTVIAAQTGIAGSTKIGKNCMIGGQVGIAGHLTIADGVKIGAKAGILSSVESNEEILLGAPAFGLNDFKKSYVVFRNLPDIAKRVKNLEKEINKPK